MIDVYSIYQTYEIYCIQSETDSSIFLNDLSNSRNDYNIFSICFLISRSALIQQRILLILNFFLRSPLFPLPAPPFFSFRSLRPVRHRTLVQSALLSLTKAPRPGISSDDDSSSGSQTSKKRAKRDEDISMKSNGFKITSRKVIDTPMTDIDVTPEGDQEE